jgi:hypothetical protein
MSLQSSCSAAISLAVSSQDSFVSFCQARRAGSEASFGEPTVL